MFNKSKMSTRPSEEMEYYHSKLVLTCVVCNQNVDNKPFNSLEDTLPQVEPTISVLDALKLLSNFKYVNIDTERYKICDTCLLNASLARLFQQLCNKSAENFGDININNNQNNQIISNESQRNEEAANKLFDMHIKSEEILVTFDKIDESIGENNYRSETDEDDDLALSEMKLKLLEKGEAATKGVKKKEVYIEVKHKECPHCKKMFRRDYLSRHIRTHTGELPHKCHLCEKGFNTKSSLTLHILYHNNERNFLCTFCGASFHIKSALQNHIRMHTNERPYVCETCGKAFRTSQARRIHDTVHTGEKRWACDKCPKRFPTSRSLRQHKVVHYDVKPWECTFCGKRFPHKHVLKSHQAKTCPRLNQT